MFSRSVPRGPPDTPFQFAANSQSIDKNLSVFMSAGTTGRRKFSGPELHCNAALITASDGVGHRCLSLLKAIFNLNADDYLLAKERLIRVTTSSH